jgi:trimeric autotransporter adhesin
MKKNLLKSLAIATSLSSVSHAALNLDAMTSTSLQALTTAHANSVTTQDLVDLRMEKVEHLSTAFIGALGTKVASMEPRDIAQFTSTQFLALSDTSLASITAAQIEEMAKETSLTNTFWDSIKGKLNKLAFDTKVRLAEVIADRASLTDALVDRVTANTVASASTFNTWVSSSTGLNLPATSWEYAALYAKLAVKSTAAKTNAASMDLSTITATATTGRDKIEALSAAEIYEILKAPNPMTSAADLKFLTANKINDVYGVYIGNITGTNAATYSASSLEGVQFMKDIGKAKPEVFTDAKFKEMTLRHMLTDIAVGTTTGAGAYDATTDPNAKLNFALALDIK